MLRYVRASDQDEAKVLQFLGQFPMDYFSRDLSRFLHATLGGVYLALTEDDEVVASAALVGTQAREMYIVGMQARSGEEREGVRGLAQFQIAEAVRLGAHTIRALVETADDLSLSVFQDDLRFGRRIQWEVGNLSDLPEVGVEPTAEAGPAWAVDRERLFEFLEANPHALWSGSDPWLPRALTESDLAQGFELGAAAVTPQDTAQPVRALALYQIKNREHFNIRYLQGEDQDSIRSVLNYLLVEANAWGVTEMRYGLATEQAQQLCRWYQKPVEAQWSGWLLEQVAPVAVSS